MQLTAPSKSATMKTETGCMHIHNWEELGKHPRPDTTPTILVVISLQY
jgi:hypothetical protein